MSQARPRAWWRQACNDLDLAELASWAWSRPTPMDFPSWSRCWTNRVWTPRAWRPCRYGR
jgi:hypothetical protein